MVATRTILVTRHARRGVLKQALAAGASGFVLKSTPAAQLAVIIRGVHSGSRYIDPSIAATALTEDESPLTIREREVLRVTRAGLSTKRIANQLHLAHGTVRSHLSSAMMKLHVGSRHADAAIAWEQGWT